MEQVKKHPVRLVIEGIDPEVKHEIKLAATKLRMSVKSWLLLAANNQLVLQSGRADVTTTD